jgi:PhoH-like ATPase
VLALTKELPNTTIILVSKDINMRIKAATLELAAEDYHNDQTLEDIDLLYSGASALDSDFWNEHGANMESWQEKGKTFYRLNDPLVSEWYPNQYLYLDDNSKFEAIVRSCDGEIAVLELAKDYRIKHNNIWGITAKTGNRTSLLMCC